MANFLRCLLFAAAVPAACLWTGCGKPDAAPPAGGGTMKVRFQTDWFPEPEHGGYY
jgi:NitT/TauT family transport system substrate-binding protein